MEKMYRKCFRRRLDLTDRKRTCVIHQISFVDRAKLRENNLKKKIIRCASLSSQSTAFFVPFLYINLFNKLLKRNKIYLFFSCVRISDTDLALTTDQPIKNIPK